MKAKLKLSLVSFSVILIASVITGCAVGPDYKRPPATGTNALPEKFGDAGVTNYGEWKVAEPAAQIPRDAWWQIYNDAELSRLESMASSNNQQIALAIANFDQARAALAVARSGFFPQLSAVPYLTRQRTTGNSAPTASSGSGRTFNLYNVSADASWEADLWGRVRRSSESSRAQLAASGEDLESMKLSIEAEVASDYFTLRALDAQSQSLFESSAAYEKALQLTQNRRNSGVADQLDVAQAETQLRSVEAQIPAIDLQRAQMRHALAVLCGQPATTFTLIPSSIASTNVPVIPTTVPSQWLEHRPDISSAERKMAAANASVGVAKAAFFPKLTLNAAGGFESINASSLFNWPSRIWSLGPSLNLPLFTGGNNHAQLKSSKAAYQGSIATYRLTVLQAFQDVEDQLAGEKYLERELNRETAAMTSAQRALDIANNRYKAGIEQYLDVITAQTTLLTHQQTVLQLRGQRMANSVALIKALGAGREIEAPYRH